MPVTSDYSVWANPAWGQGGGSVGAGGWTTVYDVDFTDLGTVAASGGTIDIVGDLWTVAGSGSSPSINPTDGLVMPIFGTNSYLLNASPPPAPTHRRITYNLRDLLALYTDGGWNPTMPTRMWVSWEFVGLPPTDSHFGIVGLDSLTQDPISTYSSFRSGIVAGVFSGNSPRWGFGFRQAALQPITTTLPTLQMGIYQFDEGGRRVQLSVSASTDLWPELSDPSILFVGQTGYGFGVNYDLSGGMLQNPILSLGGTSNFSAVAWDLHIKGFRIDLKL